MDHSFWNFISTASMDHSFWNAEPSWSRSMSRQAQEMVVAPCFSLHKGRLIFKDGQRLFEAGNLLIPSGLAGCVRLRLRDAPLLDLGIVLKHGCKFCAHGLF